MKKIIYILVVIVLMVSGIVIFRDDIQCGWDIDDNKIMRFIKNIPCLLANIPTSDKKDYRAIQRQVKKCQRVSEPSPLGDYNVCCRGTVALTRIESDSKSRQWTRFLSDMKDLRGLPKECRFFINVVPDGCYRIHSWEFSLYDTWGTLPHGDDKHAIEICPPNK